MEPVLRNFHGSDWITLALLAGLLLLVMAKGIFHGRFLNFAVLPFNNKYLLMFNKKDKLLNWFHVFLSLFLAVNLALFVYLSYNILFPGKLAGPTLFVMVLSGFLGYMFLKGFLQLANGFIFDNYALSTELMFQKISYFTYSGLAMFMANILLSYVFRDSKIVVYVACLAILLINGIGWATILKNHQKQISSNFVYFILYLCALEIAPLVLITSFLKD